jgi:hypothetical protein
MSTIQPTLKPAPVHRTAIILTTSAALIALSLAVLAIALLGGTRGTHARARQSASTYYPLIHYHGTGAPPAPAARTRPATAPVGSSKAPVGSSKTFGAVP